MRDNTWLENKMWEMLHSNFADVSITNDLVIKFGRRAKRRLGSIRRKEVRNVPDSFASRFAKSFGFSPTLPSSDFVGIHPSSGRRGITPFNSPLSGGQDAPSIITITGYFKDPQIPDYVVLATIAHELVHYTHGFSSPLEQKFEHPHRGGVVKKEFEKRGLGEMCRKADEWLKENWVGYLELGA